MQSAKSIPIFVLLATLLLTFSISGCNEDEGGIRAIPEEIRAIFNEPMYAGATWALRVADLETGRVIYDLRSDENLFLGSVRKVFTIGQAMAALGQDFTFRTPIHRQGLVDENGVLEGDLILVATGDLTMGGRRNPNNTMAVSDFDHNEANSLGNAELTATDPLEGYRALAKQIADAGITRIAGEIIIDDRLFEPYFFRNEFDIKPIFVNDDVIDVVINPGESGSPTNVAWKPVSEAFHVESTLQTLSAGMVNEIELDPELPQCFGMPMCMGEVSGEISADTIPPLTKEFPIIQTFRIVDPASYARSILIESLLEQGVAVDAPVVAKNPSELLPPKNSYPPETVLAEYVSLPYSEYARLILKVSYNIGSDTSLLLWGLTQGVDNMDDALSAERINLTQNVGVPGHEFYFVDGSGGGEATATNKAILQMLKYASEQNFFPKFLDALPVLGIDGSLAFVTDFESNPTLARARGNAFAKTGTFAEANEKGIFLRGQALGGYIDAKSGRRLMFNMFVNNVQLGFNVAELQEVFQDQGTIAAIVWREN